MFLHDPEFVKLVMDNLQIEVALGSTGCKL